MKTERDLLKYLLCERVVQICQDKLYYERELKLQGLIGITLDEGEVILVSLDTMVLSSDDRQLYSSPISFDSSSSLTHLYCSDNNIMLENRARISNLNFQTRSENRHRFQLAASSITAPSDYQAVVGLDNASVVLDMPNVDSFNCLNESYVNLLQAKQSSRYSSHDSNAEHVSTLIERVNEPPQNVVHSFPMIVESSFARNYDENSRQNSVDCSKNTRLLNSNKFTSLDSAVINSENLNDTVLNEITKLNNKETQKNDNEKNLAQIIENATKICNETVTLLSKFSTNLLNTVPEPINTEEILNTVGVKELPFSCSSYRETNSSTESGEGQAEADSLLIDHLKEGGETVCGPSITENVLAFECDISDKQLPCIQEVKKLKLAHKSKRRRPCPKCNKIFKTAGHLLRHITFHDQKQHACKSCAQTFWTESALLIHQCSHWKKQPRTSMTHGNKHYKSSSSSVPEQLHNKDCLFKCKQCDKRFTSVSTLQVHLLSHDGLGHKRKKTLLQEFTCSFCSRNFTRHNTFLMHLKSHSKVQLKTHAETNSKADSNALSKTPLITHSNALSKMEFKIHSNKLPKTLSKAHSKNYKCNICYKKFAYLTLLENHRKIHSGEQSYACSLCSKAFRYASGLYRHHRQEHTGYKPHVCNDCGKAFPWRHMLVAHQTKKHSTSYQQFACQHCDKIFQQETALQKHSMTHSENDLYVCAQCNKPFRDKQSLLTHMHIHTN